MNPFPVKAGGLPEHINVYRVRCSGSVSDLLYAWFPYGDESETKEFQSSEEQSTHFK